jgi:hypothetical protein
MEVCHVHTFDCRSGSRHHSSAGKSLRSAALMSALVLMAITVNGLIVLLDASKL